MALTMYFVGLGYLNRFITLFSQSVIIVFVASMLIMIVPLFPLIKFLVNGDYCQCGLLTLILIIVPVGDALLGYTLFLHLAPIKTFIRILFVIYWCQVSLLCLICFVKFAIQHEFILYDTTELRRGDSIKQTFFTNIVVFIVDLIATFVFIYLWLSASYLCLSLSLWHTVCGVVGLRWFAIALNGQRIS